MYFRDVASHIIIYFFTNGASINDVTKVSIFYPSYIVTLFSTKESVLCHKLFDTLSP